MLLRRNRSGFTFVELLVGVLIVGILALIVSVMLGGTQRKGRDARRVADIQAVLKAMHAAELEGTSLFGPCNGTAGPYALNVCAFSPALSESDFDFSRLRDPSNPTAVCTTASTSPCRYSIQGRTAGVRPNPSAFRIYFYLEGDTSVAAKGLRMATEAGIN